MYDFFFFLLGHVVEHQKIIANNNRSEGYNFSTFSVWEETGIWGY